MSDEIIKVGALVPKIELANPIYNVEEILIQVKTAEINDIDLLVTPELALTGVTCDDLFYQNILIEKTEEAIKKICDETADLDITLVLGVPIKAYNKLFNVALIINQGKIIGLVPKKNLSWMERKWFTSGEELYNKSVLICGQEIIFDRNCFSLHSNKKAGFAVLLNSKNIEFVNPNNITIYATLNLSGEYDVVSKTKKIKEEVKDISYNNGFGYVYVMPGLNESTSDNVYSGYSLIVDDGVVVSEGERFSFESTFISGEIKLNEEIVERIADRKIGVEKSKTISVAKKQELKEKNPYPFVPENREELKERVEEILKIQSAGLARRIKQLNNCKVVLGLSGGSDSTLALIVADRAYKKLGLENNNIIAITMPGFGTSERTYKNSVELAKLYQVDFRDIDIKEACKVHFKDIGLTEDDLSVTFENAQARERTQILMDLANKENAIVLGTGDMSELALGWCTYNGDHMSMYAVNSNVPKTLIKRIIKYEFERLNEKVLRDIVDTPISPELLPTDDKGNISQLTEESLGSYDLHDYFLYHFIKYHSTPKHILEAAREAFLGKFSSERVEKSLGIFMKRFFTQQFKRDCVPNGVKVGSISLSPRGDLVMPSDANGDIWKI